MRHGRERDGEESLSELFWSVGRRLRKSSADTLADWDVTPSQSRALRVLSWHGAVRLSALSERLHIAPRSGTEVVDGLEAKGLVARRPDPADRRATLVALTEQGVAVTRAIRSARAAEAERLFGRLTGSERAALTRILGKLRD